MFVDALLAASAALEACGNVDGCCVADRLCENGFGAWFAGCWAEGHVNGLAVALEAGSDDDCEGLDIS